MTIKIGVVMDPIESVTYKKDSTLAMLWEADSRNWQIFYLLQSDLYIDSGEPCARMTRLHPKQDPQKWFEFGEETQAPLANLDVILMRKDPPFDMNFIYTTYILDRAESRGVLVVNHPQSLRDCNEKVFATHFPQCCAPTLVCADKRRLRAFAEEHEDVILKPLDGMGGASIFRTGGNDGNLSVIIETLTQHGRTPAMAQKYIPEISKGDKRILVIDGEPVSHCLARIPAVGEVRGNLAAGGSGVVQPLSDRDRWICDQVRDTLLQKGLIFVGLDVIGDYLTEINVTSPTCIREIDAGAGLNVAGLLMDAIEKKLK
ncbi:MAG: glutathione synthase [Pseudomonadales bacterium]|jgi:glutathione synthase|uniref:glutathione synthase n=1 Tax=unclassified Ketobacter TaxID=2639109 RepID=UPI000C8F6124|nr:MULTISPECIES: glutathione synthase [unclassified Ketobacter]MAA60965.1 glutathione synthase [Pseudomonadales bacterium]MEC8810198.1 glutathione synthase [Pseudomonadota bacterium]MAQ27800.1 glutathione synthase [Pseudomonadales bacterium]RLT90875.1 MAG: glutathione synthase [Ketobacter sp. GenoA1]RLT94650.1 MAG: glutathione synthase [Ketobacter sp.]|tara:strand:- start:334 stop:1281 length:948 start_codon:yes stop_codon:yes gene_type:complete